MNNREPITKENKIITTPYKVVINGANGKMGEALRQSIDNGSGFTVAASVDKFGGNGAYSEISDYRGDADVIVDFSNHMATASLLAYSLDRRIPIVIATTGHTDEEENAIKAASEKIAVFRSGNMSLGIAVLADSVKYVVSHFPDAEVEIVEKHHDRKLDVPSGTALMLANAVKEVRPDAVFNIGRHENGKRDKNEIGIHSLRMGNVIGEHEVIIMTQTQSITLKHEAYDRRLFAEGALVAAGFIIDKAPGLYNMKDVLSF